MPAQEKENQGEMPVYEQNVQQEDGTFTNEPRRESVDPKKEKEVTLYSWTAPARPYKERNKDFWVTVIAISVLVGLILFLTEGFMPVLLIISLVFLFYVMNTVPPEEIEYKITNKGINLDDKVTEWRNISRFWFGHRFDQRLAVFETFTIPGRIELVVREEDTERLRDVITDFVPEEKVSPSGVDKVSSWFARKLPGNA